MKFGAIHNHKFSASAGAYSLVTNREHFDSQITLTDYETELLIGHFGRDNIHVGNVSSNRQAASKEFRIYPSGEVIQLNIVFPKPDKTELRLYLANRAGFKPKGGDVWFLFLKDSDVWIGSMSEVAWRIESATLKTDLSDSVYQAVVEESDAIKISTLSQRDVYGRSRAVALKRMTLCNFTCEYDPQHHLFLSRFSHRPYLEAHHLIPMGLQNSFTVSLDSITNVFALCPHCHRAVHHAEIGLAREIIGTLAERRSVLSKFGMSIEDLFTAYSIEHID